MKAKRLASIAASILASVLATGLSPAAAEELPVPTNQNSVIISIEHPVTDTAEIAYIKNNIPWGLYTKLSFSRTVLVPHLAWQSDWNEADSGIQSFKTQLDQLLAAAENAGIFLHPVICSGLARILWVYRDAKIEDIRNAQWYNDNKMASDDQVLDSQFMDTRVYGTLSRYARKMRRNLEAKAKATLNFIKKRLDEKPHVFAITSGWGEVELNSGRLEPSSSLQNWFCDYSPFAVLEFRDWIRHTGMYDDDAGLYAGQGWAAGGPRYQGVNGLAQFNADFGTAFSTWDLKYFHWSLDDDWDEDPTDDVNNDPGRIPYADYIHGGMMPTSGPHVIAGGFDPPRTMAPGTPFYDLWHLFRETLVRNFVLDMARWSHAAGIAPSRWYSHQIPADYLFGTSPSTAKTARYYSSASPLSTSDIRPFGTPGATIYDVKFPPEIYPPIFARTSKHALSAMADLSPDWAILEYDAETYPRDFTVEQSSVEDILEQYLRVYGYNPHIINFWRWNDATGEHRIKGMNKEEALRRFILKIRDKARRSLDTVFTPPKVPDISGGYLVETGKIRVQTSGRIWAGRTWTWDEWGDFLHLEIHRGTAPGFTVGSGSLVGTTDGFHHDDGTADDGNAYYYRMRAVNIAGQTGPVSEEIMLVPTADPVAVLDVNRSRLFYGAEQGGVATSAQDLVIRNIGDAGTALNWTADPDVFWISVNPPSGTGGAVAKIAVHPSGLAEGTYYGNVRIEAPGALNSPRLIEVRIRVYAPGTTSAPFGKFETPETGATVVGAVPVTGWALDDVEVAGVDIKREPHPSDNPAAIGPDGLVLLGRGLFIEGARPDVEKAYPGRPLNYRAGWGFMVLTNCLPNQGNDTFVLHAIARDREGNATHLGQKTITGANAGSALPFGTIDTPAQGGVVSGSAYRNWAWTLTPQPNMIPLDGSTLRVWVNGQALGRPNYGYYRSDIATLFPDYRNTDNAVGYFELDTTRYENGLHTINWSVADDAGNATAIGSRFFRVQNLAGSAEQEAATMTALSDPLQPRRDFTMRPGSPTTPEEAMSLPARMSFVYVGRGYTGRGAEEAAAPDHRGVVRLAMREIDRIEIMLGDPMASEPRGDIHAGFLMVGDELRSLPAGSRLDPRTGDFTWQLGPGFLGEYALVFIRDDGRGGWERSVVEITVAPRY
ncbi:MAG: hypothetical protein SCM96_05415 [Acidobacteriota bacterium]|nr:hypothetical protein [Acidobacteriota bacterium]